MQPDEKKELVQRLVELTSQDIMSEYDLSTTIGFEFAKRMRQTIQKEQIELRLKHFEIDQIRALLDFYDTDMGRSIIESQSKIDLEFASNVSVISNDIHQQVVEGIQSEILQKNDGRSSDTDK